MSKIKPSCAFAEATGGAIGALWTVLIFYPIDVAKTRLQAEADDDETGEATTCGENGAELKEEPRLGDAELGQSVQTSQKHLKRRRPADGHHTRTYIDELRLLLKKPELWYSGVGPKANLAILSSFIYFYVYASLKSLYSRVRGRPVNFFTNLALASLAGVANVLLTLPMDVIVTRMQTARRGQPRTFWAVVRSLASEGPPSFYHGLVPGLILTTNPAINYAAFDAMRVLVAGLRRRQRASGNDILLLGMLSKMLATVLTYPLIRAKVLMMAGARDHKAGAGGEAPAATDGAATAPTVVKGPETASPLLEPLVAVDEVSPASPNPSEPPLPPPSPALPSAEDAEPTSALLPPPPSAMAAAPLSVTPGGAHASLSLWEVLTSTYAEGGVAGLYVGLDAQVINTALKNAVLLHTKETISRVATFLLTQLYASHSTKG